MLDASVLLHGVLAQLTTLPITLCRAPLSLESKGETQVQTHILTFGQQYHKQQEAGQHTPGQSAFSPSN